LNTGGRNWKEQLFVSDYSGLKQLSVSDSNWGKEKTETVVNMDNVIGELHPQGLNVYQLGPTTLSESRTTPEVTKTRIQDVKETCDPEIVQVDPAYKQAVVHRDNWFMSLWAQHKNKAVAYTNDALGLERTESINEGMNAANRAVNVLEALRSQDYVTALIRAMDIYDVYGPCCRTKGK
jgi:hypothetical protein